MMNWWKWTITGTVALAAAATSAFVGYKYGKASGVKLASEKFQEKVNEQRQHAQV